MKNTICFPMWDIPASRWLLEKDGVKPEHIQVCGIDTYTDGAFFMEHLPLSDIPMLVSRQKSSYRTAWKASAKARWHCT